MKKLVLTLTLIMAISFSAYSQLSTKQMPRSFKMDVSVKNIPTQKLQEPDVDALLSEDEEYANSNLFKMQRCAAIIPFGHDLLKDAMHISLPEADMYLLRVNIPYAQALNIYSENFYIPKGGELYLWNSDKTKVLGAFTSDNNREDRVFASDYVYGEDIIIEYYQPKTVSEKASIEISELAYFYRDVINFEEEKANSDEYRSSGSCNVNANCSEGNDYRDIQRSECRIFVYMGSYGAWCSGTLVNNTAQDRKPYILTAGHCLQYSTSTSYFSHFIFYFNYQTNGCSTPSSEPSYTSLSGCTRLTYDNSYGESNSDYALLKLSNNVPESVNPFWAGWTRSTTASAGGVGFHHPSGDVKKISTFTATPTTIAYNGSSTAYHWKVKWVQTTNGFGITEGGSSGSGLFNKDHLLFGTLTGGYSSCNTDNSYKIDWYGKMDKHWSHISQWLDPSNTGVTTLAGRNYVLDTISGLEEIDASSLSLSVYPVPAKDEVTVSVEGCKDKAVLAVMDYVGRTVLSTEIPAGENTISLNLNSLESGTYFVRLYSDKNSIIKKITKE